MVWARAVRNRAKLTRVIHAALFPMARKMFNAIATHRREKREMRQKLKQAVAMLGGNMLVKCWRAWKADHESTMDAGGARRGCDCSRLACSGFRPQSSESRVPSLNSAPSTHTANRRGRVPSGLTNARGHARVRR